MAAPPQPKELKLDPKYDDYDFPTTSSVAQSGHPGYTTKEQDAQVEQLRMMLEQDGYTKNLDTLTLLRFLRARKFNVDLSKKMFVECEKWRNNFGGGVDELVQTFDYPEKPQIFEYYPQYYHKTDKDGRPVYIESLGKININKMYEITSGDRMLQNLVCEYEKVGDPRLPAASRKAGCLLETCCTIMDLKGVGITSAPSVYGYLQQASGISQNYYPERLGKMYVINAPWGFSGVFSVVKKFLDPVTVNKIHVLGSNYKSELLAQVPKENLPKEFGGECECDGGCKLSDAGPWQDAQYTKPPKWQQKAEAGTEATDKDAIKDTPDASVSEGVPTTHGGAGKAEAVQASADAAKADAPAAA
ncbi:Sec14 cytosolic factor [Aulographum hederae CBS 113979]|uniref:Sec14 cytosolic factor n=1 Tax=Aulographum hederae CBS 113979 TaxID=1176131 RepID=A0A6G1H5L1_9PEZI|nr:Sec14 cytosolic factor [Aulographum hederae CBS 113979]